MSSQRESLRSLARQSRIVAPFLLADTEDPHAELLAVVWGSRVDREHALGLWARAALRQSDDVVSMLRATLSAADRFDAQGATVQHRVRRLITRHRALGDAAM